MSLPVPIMVGIPFIQNTTKTHLIPNLNSAMHANIRHSHVPMFRNLSISSSMLSIRAPGSHLSPVNFRLALIAPII